MSKDNQSIPLTKSAVKSAAIDLMERNYATTTLEVKGLLRTQNYWAIQSTISRWMEELAREENWFFNRHDTHRNYFKNQVIANYYTEMTEEEMNYFLANIKMSVN